MWQRAQGQTDQQISPGVELGQGRWQRGLGPQSEGKTPLKVERAETGRYIVLLVHHVPS